MSDVNAVMILFFAKLREDLGVSEIQLELASESPSVAEVIDQLAKEYGPQFSEKLNQDNVVIALNHDVIHRQSLVEAGQELAFYPPVTGG